MKTTAALRDMPAMMFPQSVIDREVEKVITPGGAAWTLIKATSDSVGVTMRRMMDMGTMIYGSDPIWSSDEFFRWMNEKRFRQLLFDMAVKYCE